MKSGNQNVAEKVLARASMFCIKMKTPASPKVSKKDTNRREAGHSVRFAHLLREAIRNVKPLVEHTQSGASARQRNRRKKHKAIPMSSRRGEKLAIQ